MTASENLRLQHLFEDSMSTLTTAVETLSSSLSDEVFALQKCVGTATQGDDDDAAVRLPVSSLTSAAQQCGCGCPAALDAWLALA